MELLARHVILAEGDGVESCTAQVLGFFEHTSLVHYDRIVVAERVLSAEDPLFFPELDGAVAGNRRTLARFIDELGSTGFERRSELLELRQGYHSKILHIIAHFLDGFIGIDTSFYNMIDDSHWLQDDTRARIDRFPERFRLLFLECYSLSPKEASLLHT